MNVWTYGCMDNAQKAVCEFAWVRVTYSRDARIRSTYDGGLLPLLFLLLPLGISHSMFALELCRACCAVFVKLNYPSTRWRGFDLSQVSNCNFHIRKKARFRQAAASAFSPRLLKQSWKLYPYYVPVCAECAPIWKFKLVVGKWCSMAFKNHQGSVVRSCFFLARYQA